MLRKWVSKPSIKTMAVAAAVLLAAGSGYRHFAFADQTATPPEEDTNPYIQLYQLRVTEAEANLRRSQAVSEFAEQKLERGRILLPENAISEEEYESLTSDASVASSEVELASQKVDEAKAYLKIIDALVKRGVSIPLCTYEME